MRSNHGDYDESDDFDSLDFDDSAAVRRLRKDKHRRPIRRHLGPGSKEHWDDEDYDIYDEGDYYDSDWSGFSH